MNRNRQSPVPSARQPLAVVLGTNEIASAVAVHLKGGGFSVVLSHDPFPPVIRRAMAFHDALYGDPAVLALLHGELAETGPELAVVSENRIASPCRRSISARFSLGARRRS